MSRGKISTFWGAELNWFRLMALLSAELAELWIDFQWVKNFFPNSLFWSHSCLSNCTPKSAKDDQSAFSPEAETEDPATTNSIAQLLPFKYNGAGAKDPAGNRRQSF